LIDSPYEPPASDTLLPRYYPGEAPSLTGPAIGIMATGAISIGGALLTILFILLGMGTVLAEAEGSEEFLGTAPGLVINLVMSIFNLIVGCFVIFAAYKMFKREQYSLVTFASILVVIPCISPCCLLGIPFGIWALILLGDERVKASFR